MNKLIRTQISSATYKRYNANSSGKASPDCVKRAISMAFNVPYLEVGKQLNSIMRASRKQNWNIPSVYNQYIYQLGGSKPTAPERPMTVAEFADANPSGCYILETGPKPTSIGCGNHLTCVIDNVLYDAWDSSSQYVCTVYECSNISRHVEFTDIQDHFQELGEEISDKIESAITQYVKKYKFEESADETCWIRIKKITASGYQINSTVRYDLVSTNGAKLSDSFSFSCVFSPETDVDAAHTIISNTVKVRMYDRFYELNKKWQQAISDNAELRALGKNKSYSDTSWMDGREQKLFNSLPSTIKARVVEVSIYYPGQYSYSYTLRFKPLPQDPRPDTVALEAYTSSELKDQLDRYLKDFSRPWEDYEL